MATSADQRLLELLDKWLTSLELHTKYVSLDDDSYSKMQPWPEHQRPSRWIIDLAKQKTRALQTQLQERIKTGDTKFSDSLELMIFLANLVGSQHIERFIPIAEAATEASLVPEPTVEQPIATHEPAPVAANAATGTREMPKFVASQTRPAPPATSERATRAERKNAEPEPAAKSAAKPKGAPTAKAAPPTKAAGKPATKPKAADATPAATGSSGASGAYDQNGPTAAAREQVIADAARLVQWGRKWYELAELISSMSDRPHVTDVRRILKDNKELIDKKAGRN
jgi:hypothetical protein